jgi:hypothetical protein
VDIKLKVTLRSIIKVTTEGLINIKLGKISGSDGDEYENGCLLGCCIV